MITLFEHFVAIIERCLIAVMTISDIQLTLSEEVLDKFDLAGIADRREKMLLIHLVGDSRLGPGGVGRKRCTQAALWIIVHAHQGTKISSACAQQLQAVVFCFSVSEFVRQYHSRIPWFEPYPCQQAGASIDLSAVRE